MEQIEIRNVLYENIDVEQEDCFLDDVIIQNDSLGKDFILAHQPAYRVTDKNLIYMEGTYYNYEGVNKYNPDFSLTLIYENVKDGNFDVSKYLYFEQDSPNVSIHNFLNIAGGKW